MKNNKYLLYGLKNGFKSYYIRAMGNTSLSEVFTSFFITHCPNIQIERFKYRLPLDIIWKK